MAADIYRPAAIEQLKKLGSQLGIPVYSSDNKLKPERICLDALSKAGEVGADTLIIDTAGRLHIDEELMAELVRIKEKMNPTEILFVADAMTGRDAVTVAKHFHETLDITGIILTKMEGDARGGAALSIKAVRTNPLNSLEWEKSLMHLSPFFPTGWPPGF